jgi:hypothetical protein
LGECERPLTPTLVVCATAPHSINTAGGRQSLLLKKKGEIADIGIELPEYISAP